MSGKLQPQLVLALRQNNNMESKAYGKWYAEIARKQTLSQRGICDHIEGHNLGIPRSIIDMVIGQIGSCIVELLEQGCRVKIDGIGTFYPSPRVRKKPAGKQSGGLDDPSDLQTVGVDNFVRAININLSPDSTNVDNLTSKALKKKCKITIPYYISGAKMRGNYTLVRIKKEGEAPTPPEP